MDTKNVMNAGILVLLITVIAVIMFFVLKAATKRKEKLKMGTIKELNVVFTILCCIYAIVDIVLTGLCVCGILVTGVEYSKVIFYISLVLMPILVIHQGLYFLPYLIANSRAHENETAIFSLNLFGGWIFIAWLVALVWAFLNKSQGSTTRTAVSQADEIAKFKSL